jgi:hypothetical protein
LECKILEKMIQISKDSPKSCGAGGLGLGIRGYARAHQAWIKIAHTLQFALLYMSIEGGLWRAS